LTRTLARPIGNGTVEVHWARGKSPATRTRPPPSYWTACTTTHSRRPWPESAICSAARACAARQHAAADLAAHPQTAETRPGS